MPSRNDKAKGKKVPKKVLEAKESSGTLSPPPENPNTGRRLRARTKKISYAPVIGPLYQTIPEKKIVRPSPPKKVQATKSESTSKVAAATTANIPQKLVASPSIPTKPTPASVHAHVQPTKSAATAQFNKPQLSSSKTLVSQTVPTKQLEKVKPAIDETTKGSDESRSEGGKIIKGIVSSSLKSDAETNIKTDGVVVRNEPLHKDDNNSNVGNTSGGEKGIEKNHTECSTPKVPAILPTPTTDALSNPASIIDPSNHSPTSTPKKPASATEKETNIPMRPSPITESSNQNLFNAQNQVPTIAIKSVTTLSTKHGPTSNPSLPKSTTESLPEPKRQLSSYRTLLTESLANKELGTKKRPKPVLNDTKIRKCDSGNGSGDEDSSSDEDGNDSDSSFELDGTNEKIDDMMLGVRQTRQKNSMDNNTALHDRSILTVVANMFHHHAQLFQHQANALDRMAQYPHDPSKWKLHSTTDDPNVPYSAPFSQMETLMDQIRRERVVDLAKKSVDGLKQVQLYMDTLIGKRMAPGYSRSRRKFAWEIFQKDLMKNIRNSNKYMVIKSRERKKRINSKKGKIKAFHPTRRSEEERINAYMFKRSQEEWKKLTPEKVEEYARRAKGPEGVEHLM